MKIKMILPALQEAESPYWRPIKYSLFPPLGLATLAAYFSDDDEIVLQDQHVEKLTLDDAMQRMRPYGGCDKIDILPSYDVLMAYNERAVVCRGEDRFLTGPIIVIKDPADTALCKRILEMRMEPVQLGGKLCPAFRL